jgi:hypothetical protein
MEPIFYVYKHNWNVSCPKFGELVHVGVQMVAEGTAYFTPPTPKCAYTHDELLLLRVVGSL